MTIGEKPLVSIGLPVYNGERYLGLALDSLLAQDYENFQLIISDNASTDTTAEICRQYMTRDNRIRYVRNDVNLGAAINLTACLSYLRENILCGQPMTIYGINNISANVLLGWRNIPLPYYALVKL